MYAASNANDVSSETWILVLLATVGVGLAVFEKLLEARDKRNSPKEQCHRA